MNERRPGVDRTPEEPDTRRPRPIYTPDAHPPLASRAPPDWLKLAPVSRAILALNVIVFVVELLLAKAPGEALLAMPSRESLLFGANYAVATIRELRLETLVTCCFLHGGIIHLAFNMIVLWQAGPLVERSVGSARMAPMYLISGIVASLVSAVGMYARGVEIYSVGASGAIMGTLASALVLAWRVQGFKGPLTQSLLRWLGFNIVFGLLMSTRGGNTDNYAHIGGALAGAAIAAMWKRGFEYSLAARRAILGACTLVVVAAAAVVAVRDVADPYAGLMAGDRLNIAKIALRDGRCDAARSALGSAARLYPNDPDVLDEESSVAIMCGR